MAVDTLFLCFCEDHNMNDNTDSKNFYAPPRFLKYMLEDAPDAVGAGRMGRRDSGSPIPRKVKPVDPNTIGEELMPMRSPNSNELS